MKSIIVSLMAVILMLSCGPVLAKTSDSDFQISKADKLEALQGLKLRQHSGVITSFDPAQGSLIIKNRKGQYHLSMTPDTVVKKGRVKIGRDELKPGISVTVRYWERKGEKIARIVSLPKE